MTVSFFIFNLLLPTRLPLTCSLSSTFSSVDTNTQKGFKKKSFPNWDHILHIILKSTCVCMLLELVFCFQFYRWVIIHSTLPLLTIEIFFPPLSNAAVDICSPTSLNTGSFISIELVLRSGIFSQKVNILRNLMNTARFLSK